jgi:uncharacterized protein YjdB
MSVILIFTTNIFAAAPQPDYGIYWFTSDNVAHKFIVGEKTQGYEASKPTIIFVHGWQRGSIKNNKRDDIYKKAPEWISNGWNVGIFYWNEFADENEVKDAEAKIHVGNGPKGMRWRQPDNSYLSFSTDKSAADLFCEEYIKAMADYMGNNIRIAGHSLGNQMAVKLTYLLRNKANQRQISQCIVPKRVVLLDPFYSRGGKDYLNGRWTGEVIREHVKDLRDNNGILFESIRSSAITGALAGDYNWDLQKMCAFSELVSGYIPAWNLASKHMWAEEYYFSSLNIKSDNQPLASSTNDEIYSKMRMNKHWKQTGGKETKTLEDDSFRAYDW